MNKPGPGKFRIRWSGPYEITEIYDNNTVDVSTLQGENLGRVNMSKIKPYHEPLEAKAYVLEVGDTPSSSPKKTNGFGTRQHSSSNTNHLNEDSNYLYDEEKPGDFYEGQGEILSSPDYEEIHSKMLECYHIQPLRIGIHEELPTKIKPKVVIKTTLFNHYQKGPRMSDQRKEHQLWKQSVVFNY